MLEHIWLAVLAAVGGTVGSIVGLGGGIIAVPVLMLAGFSPAMAASTSLYAVVGNAAASTASYRRQRRVDWRAGVALGVLSVPGTVLGAALSVEAAPAEFRALFAAVLVACGAYMIKRRGILRPRPGREGGGLVAGGMGIAALVAGASFFGGTVSSFFGVGGGVVFVPLMVAAMSMSARRAAPTAQLILLFASVSGVGAHAVFGGAPDAAIALLMLAGGAGGGIAGARISTRIGERRLGALVAAVLFAAAAWMALGTGIP